MEHKVNLKKKKKEVKTMAMSTTMNMKTDCLHKDVVADILGKLQPSEKVVTPNTTPGCVTTSQEGGMKRKSKKKHFVPQNPTLPSSSNEESYNSSTSTGDLAPASLDLKCERTNSKSEHTAPLSSAVCVLKRGGWCSTHHKQAKKTVKIAHLGLTL